MSPGIIETDERWTRVGGNAQCIGECWAFVHRYSDKLWLRWIAFLWRWKSGLSLVGWCPLSHPRLLPPHGAWVGTCGETVEPPSGDSIKDPTSEIHFQTWRLKQDIKLFQLHVLIVIIKLKTLLYFFIVIISGVSQIIKKYLSLKHWIWCYLSGVVGGTFIVCKL